MYYGKTGLNNTVVGIKKFPIVIHEPSVPKWSRGIVWYQIMLDRFYNGEPSNDPEKVLPWRWNFLEQHPSEKGKYWDTVWNREFGGDLQGLIQNFLILKI